MKIEKVFLFFIAALSINLSEVGANPNGNQNIFDKFDNFFQTYVDNNGLVNYASLNSDPTLLNGLAKDINDYNLSSADDANKKAFYINAYNLLVIKQLLDNKKVKSPLDVGGFFDKTKFKVAGDQLTLNQIEKEKILKAFGDPRVHFILVCGAKGCPPLLNKAYFPSTLEDTIAKRTKTALNSDFVKVGDKKLQLSKIFEWYAGDFKKNGKSVVEYINQYRTSKISSALKISYYEYDWNINKQ